MNTVRIDLIILGENKLLFFAEAATFMINEFPPVFKDHFNHETLTSAIPPHIVLTEHHREHPHATSYVP
jgi:hypothetical protein